MQHWFVGVLLLFVHFYRSSITCESVFGGLLGLALAAVWSRLRVALLPSRCWSPSLVFLYAGWLLLPGLSAGLEDDSFL